MVSVSNKVRTVVAGILADATNGFNPTLNSICNDYGVTPFTINFSQPSPNFFTGFYGYKNLSETTNIQFPLMCLYTHRVQNTAKQKFEVFSGTVGIGIDLYLSWKKSAALPDTDTLGDAVDATLINVFNCESVYPAYGSCLYNGDIQMVRSPLALAGYSWLQNISAKISFDLNVH